VGVVIALEAASRVSGVSSPLLPKFVHHSKFSYKQGNLVVGNAFVLFIESYSKRRQSKFQRRSDDVSGVSIMSINTSTSNQSFTSKENIMIMRPL
jgi:hypothetical protein